MFTWFMSVHAVSNTFGDLAKISYAVTQANDLMTIYMYIHQKSRKWL